MRRRALLRDLGLGCTILAAASASVTVRAAPQAPQQFRAAVDVVEVTVTVTDEHGRPVSNLTREDFTILDEGRPQAISVFGRMDLALPSPPVAEGRPRRVWPVSVTTNTVAPEGRVFVLILDDQLTQPFRTLSVRRLAREFVEQYVGPADLIGVFSTGGRGVLTQEFTTDRARVLQTIDRFQGNRIRAGPELDAERVYSIATAMDAVAALAGHLQSVRGRRVAALLFSEGIDYDVYQAMAPSPIAGSAPGGLATTATARGGPSAVTDDRNPEPTAVIRAVQRAMDALGRANVVLYGVDPRGLYSLEGEWLEYNSQDKTAAKPPTREQHVRSIESLRAISARTGGFALVNTNDFGDLFRRVVAESSHYYVLGYSPSRPGLPGEYRRIAVRVRPGLRVSAREGYVVPTPRPPAARPRPVLAALDDSLPLPHLPLRVQAIPLAASAPDALRRPVQVIVEIDAAGLAFREEEGGRFSERLELAVKSLDPLAREENRAATEMTLPPLSAAQRDRIARSGVRWLTTVELGPGHHSLRVAAHATTSGQTGSVFVDVDVPPVDPNRLHLTDLALTATSAAETPTAGTSLNLPPLPTPPTTRRAFRLGETITVGSAIESSASTPPVITAAVYRLTDDVESLVLTATLPVSRPEGDAEYVSFTLPTALMEAGRYVIRLAAASAPDAQSSREVRVELLPAAP